MNLAQALKAKKKLLKEISELQSKIQSNNSRLVDAPVYYQPRELMENLNKKTQELTNIKVAIQTANIPILSKMYEMAELKSHVQFLRRINTSEGKKLERFQEQVFEYAAEFKVDELDRMVKEAEEKIEAIQEEIDQYNHSTQL
jgi:predicted  nucleic acid-binding Zn-ribbon protein